MAVSVLDIRVFFLCPAGLILSDKVSRKGAAARRTHDGDGNGNGNSDSGSGDGDMGTGVATATATMGRDDTAAARGSRRRRVT